MLAGLRRVFLKHAVNPTKGETHRQNVFMSLGSHFDCVNTSNRRSDHWNTFITECLGCGNGPWSKRKHVGRVWELCRHACVRSHRLNPKTKHKYVLRGPTVVRVCRRSADWTDDPAERSLHDLYTVRSVY